MNYILCQDKIPKKVGEVNLWNEVMEAKLKRIYFPEIGKDMYGNDFGLQPDLIVEKVKGIVLDYANFHKPFVLLTASPYVLKALEVYSDLYECQEDFEWIGVNGEKTTFQEMMKPMSEVFGKLMHGEHWKQS